MHVLLWTLQMYKALHLHRTHLTEGEMEAQSSSQSSEPSCAHALWTRISLIPEFRSLPQALWVDAQLLVAAERSSHTPPHARPSSTNVFYPIPSEAKANWMQPPNPGW